MNRKSIKRNGKKIVAGIFALNIMTAVPAGLVKASTPYWNNAASSTIKTPTIINGNVENQEQMKSWADSNESDWEGYKKSWSQIRSNYENVSLVPGATQSELNLAWYSKTQETPEVKIALKEDMSNAKIFNGKQSEGFKLDKTFDADGTLYYSDKVTVSGLKESTQYYYQVKQDGNWGSIQKYKTGNSKSFNVLYVGDPQIGACSGQSTPDAADGKKLANDGTDENYYAARNDAYNWNKVLTQAANDHSIDFIISAGDQVNHGCNEAEYAGFLSADVLKSVPLAPTVGNHETYGVSVNDSNLASLGYTNHYNTPNSEPVNEKDNEEFVGSIPGTDYYYTYGDALFIVLNTNDYNCATHEKAIKNAVNANKNCKWRIVTFHQDIYGSGKDHSDSDGIVLRTQLTPILDKYNVDMVLQGHDHTYSRSYQLSGDGKEHTKYCMTYNDTQNDMGMTDVNSMKEQSEKDKYQQENACYNIVDKSTGTIVNPKGVCYYESNSSTGSKFYDLRPFKQDYIAERSQTYTPTYGLLNVSGNALTMTTYDASTGKELVGSSTFTIVKEADKSALKKSVDAAQKITSNASKYTSVSISKLWNAINEANTVIANKSASKEEIANVSAKVSKAMTGIVKAENSSNAVSKKLSQVQSVQVKAQNDKLKITWKSVKGANSYKIKVSTLKNFSKQTTKTYIVTKGNSKTVSGLKTNKKYYVKICAISNQTQLGKYSKVTVS